jgi:hypothetical protein
MAVKQTTTGDPITKPVAMERVKLQGNVELGEAIQRFPRHQAMLSAHSAPIALP